MSWVRPYWGILPRPFTHTSEAGNTIPFKAKIATRKASRL